VFVLCFLRKPLIGLKEHSITGECSLTDFEGWKKHSGDANYNILNSCCTAINAPGGWGKNLVPTDFCQATATHLVTTDAGRKAYALYTQLLTLAVANHPAAVGIELFNEPPMPTVEARWLYGLYRECYKAIREVSADMAVGLADTGSRSEFSTDERLQHAD